MLDMKDSRPTIIDFVEKYTHQFAGNVYLREKVDGVWKEITQEQTRNEAHRIGAGLMALGLEKGDKIALLSESRAMWIMAEIGALYAGAVDVPLSVNLGEGQDLVFRIRHSEAQWILVSGNQLPKIRTIIAEAFPGSNTGAIALGTDGKTIRISTNYKIESNSPTTDDECETILYNALKKHGLVSQASVEAFKNPDVREGGSIISSQKVGPSVAKDITYGAIISVIIALIAIFLYILLRFRNVAFSVGSVVALAVDTLVVLGIYSLCWGWMPFSLEIDQTFIGAILTVIGYSINDKVVVFDRIRENLGLYPKKDKQQLFNESINQTLARTINTSLSTLIVLLCIFVLAGASIRSFAFAMILGVIFGTLSSICIASPVAYLVMGRKIKEEE